MPEPADNAIPVRPLQVQLARWGFVGGLLVLAILLFFGGATVSVETQGETTIYTAKSSLGLVFWAMLPVLTGILTIVYLLQPGIFRFYGAVLGLITAWLISMAFTWDISNHFVQVSPEGIIREVGTTRDPIRQEIQFADTTLLFIDEVPDNHRTRYELVAIGADRSETRVPIFDMMRAALPQIIETARRQGVAIQESETGEIIPSGLRSEMKE